ncbi:class I SAM-dependent methyltransferase [soil metagenome]
MSSPPSGSRAKAFGAFYTDPLIARFLVWWALRTGRETIIDPSFGGGVFLEEAAKRIQLMGGEINDQVYGVELDADVHSRVSAELREALGVSPKNLILADFFEVAPSRLGPFDAVVGNPPFIRYQSFSGASREQALRRALDQNVELSKLASSWAAFLVHAVALLKPGGRLAMVLPVELGHAAYARPLVDFLQRSFGTVTLLTFEKRLFVELSQDTLLLLAEARGEPFGGLLWQDLTDGEDLAVIQKDGRLPLAGTRSIDLPALATGKDKLALHFISERAADLYQELASSPSVKRLGDLAEAGIGYVTGANPFFHLSPAGAKERDLSGALLKRAVFRGKALTGLSFDLKDWQRAAARGDAGYLFAVEAEEALTEAALAYIRAGEEEGVPGSYKCRTRSPWYRVPHVYLPDAFLTYMSGLRPRLVANEAGAVAPNTLHVVRLRPHAALSGRVLSGKALSALWQTSLTCLSAELEGHALGGGMLKLEPSEAKRVMVPFPAANGELVGLAEDWDAIVRRDGEDKARRHANEVILEGVLGLSKGECRLLRDAAEGLRSRRYRRGGRSGSVARPSRV